jgi:hypothetical protein
MDRTSDGCGYQRRRRLAAFGDKSLDANRGSFSLLEKADVYGGRLLQLGLVALVTLLYSGRDARAFALCNGCPELFASRPAAPAQKAA